MDTTPSPTPAPALPTPRSAQVALGVFLAVTLGLLFFRGYLNGLGARPTEVAPVALLNLNTANQAQLEQVPGFGPVLAQKIVEERESRGPFGSVEELRRVKGIGPMTLDKVRAFVRAETPTTLPAPSTQLPSLEPLVLERKPTTPSPAPYPRYSKSVKVQPGDPPINVNTATAEELMRLPGIGKVTAARIIEAREIKPFRYVIDLDEVKGIGRKTLEKVRPFVVVE